MTVRTIIGPAVTMDRDGTIGAHGAVAQIASGRFGGVMGHTNLTDTVRGGCARICGTSWRDRLQGLAKAIAP